MKLSKREIIMLTLLILIAMVFVEYRFVIVPGIARYDELVMKRDQVSMQVDAIKLNIATTKNLAAKRDANLAEIREVSKPFIDKVQPDTLLAFTHDLFLRHGFDIVSYDPGAVLAAQMTPEFTAAIELTYDLKVLAQQYQNLDQPEPTLAPGENGNEEQPGGEGEPPADDENGKDIVERYSVIIEADGSYAQVYDLLADIQSMNRSVFISNINMTPIAPETVAEPSVGPEPGQVTPTPSPTPLPDVEAPEARSADVQLVIWLEFVGISKLEESSDDLSRWNRPGFTSQTDDPFYLPTPTPTISPIPTEVTVETTVEEP